MSGAPASYQLPLRRKGKTTLLVFVAMLFAFAFWVLVMIQPFLLAVAMGGILALLADAPYQVLRGKGVRSKWASLLVTLGIVFLVIGPISTIATLAVKQGISVGQEISDSNALSFESIRQRLSAWELTRPLVRDTSALEAQIRNVIQSGARIVSGAVLSIAGRFPNLVLQLALASLACFFLLMDGRKFLAWMADKIPMDYDVRARLVSSFRNTAISVIWATLAAAGVQAAIMLTAYVVLGIPAAFLAAGATFLFAWIPLLGSTPVWVAGAIYLATQGATVKVVVMLAFGVVTGLADNFVRPLVLKGRGEMHPLVSLVAIFGGIEMFGITGVFIGPILIAVLIALLQIWPSVGRRYGLTFGQDSREVERIPTEKAS